MRCSYYSASDSGLVETGHAATNYKLDKQAVGSEVQVFRTVADAATSWKRNAKPALARCTAEILRRELAKQGMTFRVASAKPIPFPRLTQRTAAWRISGHVLFAGLSVPIVFDYVALARERTIALLSVGYDRGRPTSTEVRRLARLLAARMR